MRRTGDDLGHPGFGYQPALDGVRGVAVALVLLFHAGFGWMTGGYVGVSVFFTLSGYLITSLAVVEHDRGGRLDVGAFYARRIRRLVPASLLCVLGVLIMASLGAFGPVEGLRRGVWGALFQVYNWVALSAGHSYAELIGGAAGARSPLDHYWSLAIEEQFYWVWPLVLTVAFRGSARRRWIVVGAATAAAALAAPLIAGRWGPDAAYWATPARLAEILIGALLALALAGGRARRLPAWSGAVGAVGLAVVLGVAVAWPAAGGPAYQGWFPAFALASAAVIVGVQVDGPLRRLLSWRPLVALGAISYGVYLYHWPIYVWLDERRVPWPTSARFALRVAVTLLVAAASYRLLEQPVRRRRDWTIRPAAWAGAGAALVVAATALILPVERRGDWVGSEEARAAVTFDTVVGTLAPLVPATDPGPETTTTTPSPSTTTPALTDAPEPPGSVASTDPTTASAPAPTAAVAIPARAADPTTVVTEPPVATAAEPTVVREATSSTITDAPVDSSTPGLAPTTVPAADEPATIPVATVPASPPPEVVTPARPVRVLVVGDSTASALATGLVEWAGTHPQLAQVTVRWAPGCGFIRVGDEAGESAAFAGECDAVWASLPGELPGLQPDVAVLMNTVGDGDVRVVDGRSLAPGAAELGELQRSEYLRFTDELIAAGVRRVVWVIPPEPAESLMVAEALRDPARATQLRDAIDAVATVRAEHVTVLDLAAWAAGQSESIRPDGLHLSPEASTALADEWLGARLVELALAS